MERPSILVPCLLIVASLLAPHALTAVQGQTSSAVRVKYRNPFIEVNEAASSARRGSAAEIGALVNLVIDLFSPVDVPAAHSLRGRLVKAEIAFRDGSQAPITEEAVVGAMNELAHELNPDCSVEWLRSSVAQLHVFRTGLKPLLPQIIGKHAPQVGRYDPGPQMSPLEAMLVLLYLNNAKTTDPSFRVPPDEWVAGLRQSAKKKQGSGVGPAPQTPGRSADRLLVVAVPAEVSKVLRATGTALRDETGSVTKLVHRFLDGAGVQR